MQPVKGTSKRRRGGEGRKGGGWDNGKAEGERTGETSPERTLMLEKREDPERLRCPSRYFWVSQGYWGRGNKTGESVSVLSATAWKIACDVNRKKRSRSRRKRGRSETSTPRTAERSGAREGTRESKEHQVSGVGTSAYGGQGSGVWLFPKTT